jgi:hypothetical protein
MSYNTYHYSAIICDNNIIDYRVYQVMAILKAMPRLTDRQQQLHEWLQTQGSISIAEIEARFGVSIPTASRDMRALLEAGLVTKTNRGLKLATPAEVTQKEGKCAFCGGAINERATFVIQMQDGSQRSACCPHCGLMALSQPGVVTALASDFLYGRMVNARQAAFLVESSISLCCEPSVLCFGNLTEAKNFQKGFGGKVCTLDAARALMADIMSLNNSVPDA